MKNEVGHELVALKTDIEARCGSVYRFCLVTGLNKSAVYLVLRNAYPGNADGQIARIRAALAGQAGETDLAKATEALRLTACAG